MCTAVLRVAPEWDSAFHRTSVLLQNKRKWSRGGSGGNLSFDIAREVHRKTPVNEICVASNTVDIYIYKVIFGWNFLAPVQKSWNTMEGPESWQWGPSSNRI